MNHPTAVLLDKDGVLIDFHRRWAPVAIARARLVAERIPGLSSQNVATWLGLGPDGLLGPGPMAHLGREAIARELENWLRSQIPGDGDWQTLVREAFEEADGHLGPVVARPGALDCLERWKRAGVCLVVVTSDRTDRAIHDLENVGMAPYLDLILGADRVARGKPFPDLALQAARQTGLSLARSWLVGDTREDLEMGREAGAGWLIGLTGGGEPASVARPMGRPRPGWLDRSGLQLSADLRAFTAPWMSCRLMDTSIRDA